MGPLRRGLTLALLWPSVAWAEACDAIRPTWDGSPVGPVDEALALVTTVPVLVLLLATALAWRFRSPWGGLVVVVGWTLQISFLAFFDLRAQAAAEGCVGSPILFMAAAAAISVATILYTAPLKQRSDDGET